MNFKLILLIYAIVSTAASDPEQIELAAGSQTGVTDEVLSTTEKQLNSKKTQRDSSLRKIGDTVELFDGTNFRFYRPSRQGSMII